MSEHVLGQHLFALKIAPARPGIWTTSNKWFWWAHPSPHSKRHLDWFNRLCTAQGRASLYLAMDILPHNYHRMGDLEWYPI